MKKPQKCSSTRLPAMMLAAMLVLLPLFTAAGQGLTEPRREQLLNGLKLLIVNRQGDPNVVLRLRIHSGSAFDLSGKEGLISLLTDALFNAETREYVKDELGGRLEVSTNYDAINVTLEGKATDFERLAELLRNAVVNTQLTPDIVEQLRAARIKTVREVNVAPDMIADRAVARRLFGTHPYGRLVGGSPETLARVERADLLLARERFLNPNNTTLIVIGGIEAQRALRVFRQFLGSWRKSDRTVPATFRQPDAPDARTLLIDFPAMPDAEVRLAVRGLARADRDFAAAQVLVALARERWMKSSPELKGKAVSVVHEAHAQGGVFRMGVSAPSPVAAAQALESARGVLRALANAAPSADELDIARRATITAINDRMKSGESFSDVWLDEQTYKSDSTGGAELLRAINSLTPPEVQRVAARLFLNTPVASVAVGNAATLRAELARVGGVEVLGETTLPTP
ncbi:MAG: insulinase family protein, partial [Acidobacteria bacterium]|nr:insulinase family protein [Acidobacteriota bacterium]